MRGENVAFAFARLRKVSNYQLKTEKNVILEFEDDGCGITPPQVVDLSSMGLRNLRERASLIGGNFYMLMLPGKGKRIAVMASKDKIS